MINCLSTNFRFIMVSYIEQHTDTTAMLTQGDTVYVCISISGTGLGYGTSTPHFLETPRSLPHQCRSTVVTCQAMA